jgi:hypothetical protein
MHCCVGVAGTERREREDGEVTAVVADVGLLV